MKPFMKWAGGKRWLADHAFLAKVEYSGRYIEPFLGGGAIFFHLNPKRSILSDLNSRLIEAYLAIRDDPHAVETFLKNHQRHHSHSYYYETRHKEFDSAAERAAHFIYLNRTCWNGLYRENLLGKFNAPIGTKSTIFDPTEDFVEISTRLSTADIRCCDFEEVLAVAGDGDFVFCDPPYTVAHNLNGFIKYNQRIFSWEDQIRLQQAATQAAERGAKVCVTNADHPSLHELYRNSGHIRVIQRSSVISGSVKGRRPTSEILVEMSCTG